MNIGALFTVLGWLVFAVISGYFLTPIILWLLDLLGKSVAESSVWKKFVIKVLHITPEPPSECRIKRDTRIYKPYPSCDFLQLGPFHVSLKKLFTKSKPNNGDLKNGKYQPLQYDSIDMVSKPVVHDSADSGADCSISHADKGNTGNIGCQPNANRTPRMVS